MLQRAAQHHTVSTTVQQHKQHPEANTDDAVPVWPVLRIPIAIDSMPVLTLMYSADNTGTLAVLFDAVSNDLNGFLNYL